MQWSLQEKADSQNLSFQSRVSLFSAILRLYVVTVRWALVTLLQSAHFNLATLHSTSGDSAMKIETHAIEKMNSGYQLSPETTIARALKAFLFKTR